MGVQGFSATRGCQSNGKWKRTQKCEAEILTVCCRIFELLECYVVSTRRHIPESSDLDKHKNVCIKDSDGLLLRC
jgi:hypothetical protein